jgi:hypothetical protein
MKLLELHGHQRYADFTLSQNLNKFIIDKKIKVESGTFGFAIIPKDKDYVYKCWTKDAGFEAFLDYVQKHKSDKHLPKLIGSIRSIPLFFKHNQLKDLKLKVQRVEKLDELQDDQESPIEAVIKMVRNFKSGHEPTTADILERTKRNAFHTVNHDNEGEHKELIDEISKLGSFVESLVDIRKALPNAFKEDFLGNIMLRGKIPVIIDPYYDAMGDYKTASDLLNTEDEYEAS